MSNKMQFFFSSLDFAANKDRVFTLLIKEGLNRHIGDFCAKKHRLARRCRTVCHIFVACRLVLRLRAFTESDEPCHARVKASCFFQTATQRTPAQSRTSRKADFLPRSKRLRDNDKKQARQVLASSRKILCFRSTKRMSYQTGSKRQICFLVIIMMMSTIQMRSPRPIRRMIPATILPSEKRVIAPRSHAVTGIIARITLTM